MLGNGRERAWLAALVCLLIVTLACGDAEESAMDGAVPPPPSDKAGPLRVELDMSDGPALVWDSSVDATSFSLIGTVRYGPTCEGLKQGVNNLETIAIEDELGSGERKFELPRPDDERLGVLVEAVITIEARDESGEIVVDGIAFSADALCE